MGLSVTLEWGGGECDVGMGRGECDVGMGRGERDVGRVISVTLEWGGGECDEYARRGVGEIYTISGNDRSGMHECITGAQYRVMHVVTSQSGMHTQCVRRPNSTDI